MNKSTISLGLIPIACSTSLIPSLFLLFFLCEFFLSLLYSFSLYLHSFPCSPSLPLPSFLCSGHQSLKKALSWVSRMAGPGRVGVDTSDESVQTPGQRETPCLALDGALARPGPEFLCGKQRPWRSLDPGLSQPSGLILTVQLKPVGRGGLAPRGALGLLS